MAARAFAAINVFVGAIAVIALLAVGALTFLQCAITIDKGPSLADLSGAISRDISFDSNEAAVLQYLDDRGFEHGPPKAAADYPELQQDLVFQHEIQPLPDERVARAIEAIIPANAYEDAFNDLSIAGGVRAYFLLDGDGLLVDIVFAAELSEASPS